MNSITIFSKAKINLGLQVLNKRPDGFHNINTLFIPISFKDKLYFQNSKEFNVFIYPKLQIPMEKNLAYIAALKLKEHYNIDNFANIHIQKKIPLGGGLGGGSSNAASTLLALVDLWELPFEYDELHKIAASIGSDVPFFLRDQAAIGKSRGEELEYIDFKLPWWTLIVNPEVHISTAEAYKNLKRNRKEVKGIDFVGNLYKCLEQPELMKDVFVNDFEYQLFQNYPKLIEIKQTLYDSGALFASLSGSGSSFFGFFNKKKDIQKASKQFLNYFTNICEPDIQ